MTRCEAGLDGAFERAQPVCLGSQGRMLQGFNADADADAGRARALAFFVRVLRFSRAV